MSLHTHAAIRPVIVSWTFHSETTSQHIVELLCILRVGIQHWTEVPASAALSVVFASCLCLQLLCYEVKFWDLKGVIDSAALEFSGMWRYFIGVQHRVKPELWLAPHLIIPLYKKRDVRCGTVWRPSCALSVAAVFAGPGGGPDRGSTPEFTSSPGTPEPCVHRFF